MSEDEECSRRLRVRQHIDPGAYVVNSKGVPTVNSTHHVNGLSSLLPPRQFIPFLFLSKHVPTNCNESERPDKSGTQSCTKLRRALNRAVHVDEALS